MNPEPSTKTHKGFRPSVLSTVLVMVLIPIFLSLSLWQMGRVEEKRALEAKYLALQKQTPLSLNDAANTLDLAGRNFLPVKAQGQYLSDQSFLLDSQVHEGKPGYHLISLLAVEGQEYVILVNRGWLAAGKDRQILPSYGTPSENLLVSGHLTSPRTAVSGFKQDNYSNKKATLFIDTQAIADRIGSPVLPMVMNLKEDNIDPLSRSWPKYEAKVEMHEFYVAHWVVVAILTLLIYIYLGFKNGRKDLPKIDPETSTKTFSA